LLFGARRSGPSVIRPHSRGEINLRGSNRGNSINIVSSLRASRSDNWSRLVRAGPSVF